MQTPTLLVTLILALLTFTVTNVNATPAPAHINVTTVLNKPNKVNPASQPGFTRCKTTSAIPAEANRAIQAEEARWRSLTASGARRRAPFSATIPIAFHSITCKRDGAGTVTDARITAQVARLNKDYNGTGFNFYLRTKDVRDNCTWYYGDANNTYEVAMKNATRLGKTRTLNLWTMDLAGSGLGYATFPNSYKSAPKKDGVVLDLESLPGGAFTGYNLGATASHETGHWLALFHTFQGGCASPGDSVSDTPAQGTPTNGCPADGVQDTCPTSPGLDLIHNYMDYSNDGCYRSFTPGQISRMQAAWRLYRAI